MNDPNRLMKWCFMVLLVVLAMVVLYPPSEKLKGGIDLVGGTSMLFEIDTTGLPPAAQTDLSGKMMRILKERVDPKGQMNLEWRPVGNTRLEVRMPRPPKEALARREKYNDTLDALAAMNLSRFDVESALNAPPEERPALMEKLQRGIEARKPLIDAVAAAFDKQRQAAGSGDAAAISTARAEYEDAMGKLMVSIMPIARLTDVLALPAGGPRDVQMAKLRAEFPAYDTGTEGGPEGKLLTKAVTAYDAWAKNKADLEDPSDLKRRLRGAGVLEFRILADRDPTSPTFTTDANGDPGLRQPIAPYVKHLEKYGPRPKAGDHYRWLPVDDVVNFMSLDSIADFETQKNSPAQPIVEEYAGRYYVLAHNDPQFGLLKSTTGPSWSLTQAYPDQNPLTGENVVSFVLDPRGGQRFGELTENNLDRSLCIVLDNTAMSHATIRSRITTHGQISGRFSLDKVQNMVRTLEAGSLPARLRETPLMENTIGPSLGETNRTKGMHAAVWGTITVAVFMVFYYGFVAGGVADLALALNLLFVLAVMALLQATFTLPGIAGLILTVGMAVDANVLIFERFREERDRGVIFKRALNAGYDKAFSTIMDANLTTLLTCIVLGFVASEEVKGFAIVLGLGIVTSMFTALFVTRLVFNSLIAKGWLKDLSMRRIIGVPSIDWMGLRRYFWPVSGAATLIGLGLFVGMTTERTEQMYDIEFLGGTSLQLDLLPTVHRTDDEMTAAITADQPSAKSAVRWLRTAADRLEAATARVGDIPGEFVLSSPELPPGQIAALMRSTVEDVVERDGIRVENERVVLIGKTDAQLTEASFKDLVKRAAAHVRSAADHLRSARVQSVGEVDPARKTGKSYEVVTVESDRDVVQAAVLAVLGDELAVQRSIQFHVERDETLTKEPYFVVESEDEYLSDVIGGDANFDVRRFRGGVAIVVDVNADEQPVTADEIKRRMREVGLQPEFEQYRTRESAIIPLGAAAQTSGGVTGHHRFAIVAGDDALRFEDDEVQWQESLAKPELALVEAALGQEKSLSKVVQFAAPIAKQTRNRATMAILLSLAAIVAYLWLRFGTKEYGLAACVCLIHDVAITLGLVVISQLVFNTFVGKALMLEEFRIDLPMIAAVLTVIGYSLNDTIVIFDRIRETKGRSESLTARVVDTSINHTLSRTLLTSITTLVVVFVLYVMGGAGVHGFSFAVLVGVGIGTYSSIGVAAPLLYRPRVLHGIVVVIAALLTTGVILELVPGTTAREVLIGIVAAGAAAALIRIRRDTGYARVGRAVPA